MNYSESINSTFILPYSTFIPPKFYLVENFVVASFFGIFDI